MSRRNSRSRRCERFSSAACSGRRADLDRRTRTRRSCRMTTMQTDAAFAGLQTAQTLTAGQIEERARALRDQLDLDEKISLMHGQLPLWPGLAAMVAPGGYSSRFWVAGEVTRLGIPGIRFTDGPRGVILEGATTF